MARDVRDDFLLLDQPTEELARSIGRVGGKPPRLQIEVLLCSIQHRLGCSNFIISASWRRLDIDDHGVLDVDDVVQPIAELHPLVGVGCPCRLRVATKEIEDALHKEREILLGALWRKYPAAARRIVAGLQAKRSAW
jgi:hypothetical protein